jgi:hypothetical protein
MSRLMDVILSVGHEKLEQFTVYRLADGGFVLRGTLPAAESIRERWYQKSTKLDKSFPVISY